MLIAGYSAYWVDNNRDFNTVIFDENNKVRDIEYIATEYHKLFKDTDWENMPEFDFLDNNNLNMIQSISTNSDPTLVGGVYAVIGENLVAFSHSLFFLVDSTNSIEDMVTNLKAGFEILEKAYPKDKKSLDKIYTEIPMHFTKYTNQENYQEKEYSETYYSILEDNNMEFHQIVISIINKEYYLSMGKIIHKEEK